MVRRSGLRAAALALCAAVLPAQGPANVLLVVNRNSAQSREIASYYASARSVPAGNVCFVQVTPEEEIGRTLYEDRIAGPLKDCLRRSGLATRILYLVTTLGMPLKIRGSGGMSGDAASVDSELALLYGELQGRRFERAGPLPNPFFAQRTKPFERPGFPIYLVTRLAAYDAAGAKALVTRALAAKNRGRFVIDARSPAGQGGETWLRQAAIRLPRERVVFDDTPEVLYGVEDVIGYASWGSNDRNRTRRHTGFRWLPGAIATQFVSTDGRTFARPPAEWNIGPWSRRAAFFAGSPQSLAADLIEEGVTGASGHVYEPFLGYTPRPDILLPAYYSGRNLAESFYLAMPALSWQNIVIGDPLCALGPPGR